MGNNNLKWRWGSIIILIAASCQHQPQSSENPVISTEHILTTKPTQELLTSPKEPTEVELMHIIFSDDGSPDGTTALLYALCDPGLWVDSLVVSHGEARPRTYIQHMGRMLDDFGIHDIQLGQGENQALIPGENFPDFLRDGADAFWGFPIPNAEKTYPVEDGADLIVRALNESPAPLAYFSSGSLTDLALALRQDPGIRDKISGIYIMGGAVFVPGNLTDFSASPENVYAEWNIYIDPLAAAEVFQSGVPITLVPLDATNQVAISMRQTQSWRMGGPIADFAADMYDWLLGNSYDSKFAIWDVMTAQVMAHPELCETTPLHLEVVTEPGDHYGQTVVVEGGEPNVNVCLEPDIMGITTNLEEVFAGCR